jgi:cytochrome c-type biogenesis protein CcmH/NrfF
VRASRLTALRPRAITGAALTGAALALVGCALALLVATPGALASAAHPTLPVIEPQVMCVTCKIPLNAAESPEATDERAFISEEIKAGRNEAQIKRALVSQYGPAVLALPSAKGFDLAVYIVPIVVVLALLAVLALLLPRWRASARREREGPAPSPLSAADAERLDQDMARFD